MSLLPLEIISTYSESKLSLSCSSYCFEILPIKVDTVFSSFRASKEISKACHGVKTSISPSSLVIWLSML